MKQNITMTAELWNLLTLNDDDQLDDFTRDDILQMIKSARESIEWWIPQINNE